MSLNVLIIPEDFRKDQYVLGPIMKKMLAAVSKPNARIVVCKDPLLGGIDQALDWRRIEQVIGMYSMVQVFILLVDRDGVAGRRQALDHIETAAHGLLSHRRVLFGENAWQEIEVLALAGQELPRKWTWQDIRHEIHPKEIYFEPLAAERGLTNEPGEGRTTMGREAAQNYTRVRSRCPEDIQVLESRLREWLGANEE